MTWHCATWLGAALAALALTGPADGQAIAVHRSQASADVAARIAITAQQNFLLGSMRLRSSTVGPSVPARVPGLRRMVEAIDETNPAIPAAATFVVTGEAGQAISIAVPPRVVLTRMGGGQVVNVLTALDLTGVGNSRMLAASPGSDGILSFRISGRVMTAPNTVAGEYRGQMAATAQYN